MTVKFNHNHGNFVIPMMCITCSLCNSEWHQ